MKRGIAVFMLLASVMACHAQTVNIFGVVKNSGGSGLEGVKVRLGKADIAATTASDGSFTLKGNIGVDIKHQPYHTSFGNERLFLLKDHRIFLNMTQQAEVKVTAYDCNGSLLVSYGKVVLSGNHAITLPQVGSGVQVYRISLNNEVYTFKNVTGTATNRGPASSLKEIGLAKQAKATARIDDALLFIKAGYQLYRIAMTNPDTSGLQITMIPLETGTVTDVDGNVYQTVRIGNQVWTAENLRTTKFNDGAGIGSAYHFYNNTTDAAAKKKWGALYEWSAVKTGKLAPAGWHVPTNAEWDTLQNYLIAHGYNYDGTTSGNKVAKSMAATTDWRTSSEPGALSNDLSLNNVSGFSALPAGWRYWSGNEFKDQNSNAYWWTATARDATYSYICSLWYINFSLDMTYMTLIECSVRLVRNS